MVNSCIKGKGFERTVANLLTEQTGVKWHRVPNSGGMQTSFDIQASQFAGDVFTENPDMCHICVECKSSPDFSFNDFFRRKSKFFSWLDQCEGESSDQWILLFKIDYKGIFLVYDTSDKPDVVDMLETDDMYSMMLEVDDKIYQVEKVEK
ncbi:MAG: putative PDDEXK endonuclease [bacterium]